MYIHANFQYSGENKNIKQYKTLLKEITSQSLRRACKFDVLSMYGALRCIKSKNLNVNKNTAIHIGSDFSAVSTVVKIVESISEENSIVMPFDFLNINGNNACFNISQTLDIKGENILISSAKVSFLQTLELCFNKSQKSKEFYSLIGKVEESLSLLDIDTLDISSWLYCSNKEEGSLAQIVSILNFNSKREYKKYIINIDNKITYDLNEIFEFKNGNKFITIINKCTDNHYVVINIQYNE